MTHSISRLVTRLEPNFGRRADGNTTIPGEGEQNVLLIAEPTSTAGHRLFIAWPLGPEAADDKTPWRLCIIELKDMGEHWMNQGAVAEEYSLEGTEDAGTKVVELGMLSPDGRKALEKIAETTQVRVKTADDQWDEKTWIKSILLRAVRQCLLDANTVDAAVDEVLTRQPSHS